MYSFSTLYYPQRIQSKLCYTKSVNNPAKSVHNTDTLTLVVSRTRSNFGDRTFAAAGPQVSNSLPEQSQTM